MDVLTKSLTSIDTSISVVRTNPYIASVVTLFLILYAGLAAPALPASIAALFEHSTFKLLVMIMILYLVKNQDISTALLVSIGLSLSLNTLPSIKLLFTFKLNACPSCQLVSVNPEYFCIET